MSDLIHTGSTPGIEVGAPRESYGRLFLRFLRFGLLAWGGPVAQIAMLRQELVENERWISRERFNRTLAVYQALPGPEASELCVYFGMLARGRLGGLLAGLGFLLPGLVLMLAASWFYVTVGITSPFFGALFAGVQAAVVALIVRGVQRIGAHAIHNRTLAAITLVAFVAQLAGVHFGISLAVAGLAAFLAARRRRLAALLLGAALLGFAVLSGLGAWLTARPEPAAPFAATVATTSLQRLFVSGLRAGVLTFGGAYTAIPFLQNDAVAVGGWMSNQQFLDGIALGGILPAPLIIFGTFVGYVGGGPWGALVMTLGIFLPAFAFTLVGHQYLERLVDNQALHNLLDGITAGVVGLIAATMIELFRAAITGVPTLLIFGVTLGVLFRWRSSWATPVVVLAAAAAGILIV